MKKSSKSRVAITLVTVGAACLAGARLLEPYAWGSFGQQDIGIKDPVSLPAVLMPLLGPTLIELYLVPTYPLLGAVLALRLAGVLFLLVGGILSLKAGLPGEMKRLLVSRNITLRGTPGEFMARLGLITAAALVVFWTGYSAAVGIRDVVVRNRNRRLVTAASQRELGMVTHLLDQGADPNYSDDGQSPLSAAVQADDTNVVVMLLDHGAHLKNEQVELISEASSDAMMTLLTGSGADVDAVDPHDTLRNTPLMTAAVNMDVEKVRLLLRHGADPNKKNVRGETALDILEYLFRGIKRSVLPSGGPQATDETDTTTEAAAAGTKPDTPSGTPSDPVAQIEQELRRAAKTHKEH